VTVIGWFDHKAPSVIIQSMSMRASSSPEDGRGKVEVEIGEGHVIGLDESVCGIIDAVVH
jgi:hypothetical protein